MAARKHAPTVGGFVTVKKATRAPRTERATTSPAAINVDALFADTMGRFPLTMARLAE